MAGQHEGAGDALCRCGSWRGERVSPEGCASWRWRRSKGTMYPHLARGGEEKHRRVRDRSCGVGCPRAHRRETGREVPTKREEAAREEGTSDFLITASPAARGAPGLRPSRGEPRATGCSRGDAGGPRELDEGAREDEDTVEAAPRRVEVYFSLTSVLFALTVRSTRLDCPYPVSTTGMEVRQCRPSKPTFAGPRIAVAPASSRDATRVA